MAASGDGAPTLFRWLLDTRKWVVEPGADSQYQKALSRITPEQRTAVGKYLHDRDRLMSLGSHLLKYTAISRTCCVPWSEITVTRDEHGKPIYVTRTLSDPQIQFNVSHQAGLVALVGISSSSVRVGVDIVCVNERDDYRSIQRRGGIGEWVSMYEEVFSPREVQDMKRCACGIQLEDGTDISAEELGQVIENCQLGTEVTIRLRSGRAVSLNADIIIDAQLRLFYAHWCLKEAYIKMAGEALLADWLKELEFRNVRPPRPVRVGKDQADARWGETVEDFETVFRGQRVPNLKIGLSAFEEQYMIATAVSAEPSDVQAPFPAFTDIDVERDVFPLSN